MASPITEFNLIPARTPQTSKLGMKGPPSREPNLCPWKCKTYFNFTATIGVDTSYLAVSLNFVSICICTFIQMYLSYFLSLFVLKTTSVQRRVVLEVSGQSCKGSSSAASTIVGKMSTNSTLNMVMVMIALTIVMMLNNMVVVIGGWQLVVRILLQ